MIETPHDDLIQDLHAMCERGLSCHIHSNTKEMCVTCRAAHHLYAGYRQNQRLRLLHAEWMDESLSPESAAFHDDLVRGCYGPFPPKAPS